MSVVTLQTPALTVWQPWASLIAAGVKRYETRSWPTGYRGPIVIHAGARWTRAQWDWQRRPLVRDLIEAAGMESSAWNGLKRTRPWPLGLPVAVAVLTDCLECHDPRGERLALIDSQNRTQDVDVFEAAVGDFSPGRFAFRLERVRRVDVDWLPVEVEFRGRQGLFVFEAAQVDAINAAVASEGGGA